jgi:hypothetical protein
MWATNAAYTNDQTEVLHKRFKPDDARARTVRPSVFSQRFPTHRRSAANSVEGPHGA